MRLEWTGVRADPEWAYSLFPLPHEAAEALSLEWVAQVGEELLDRAAATDDQSHFGPVLHWAHLLKTAQQPQGDWPLHINPRTGECLGPERTRTPARLLERLGRVLDSSEFDDAVALAAQHSG